MNKSAAAHSDRTVIGLRAGLLQCAGLSVLAFLVSALFGPKPLWAVVVDGGALVWQLAAGTAIAFAFAIPTLMALLNINFFGSFRSLVLELPNKADFDGLNPLWLGLCAGVGEELLFRGSLQPLLGIWWTALLFALAHYGTGGFASMNLMKCGYAAFLFLTSLMLGLVLLELGLLAAVAVHTVADAYIFFVLRAVVGRQLPRAA